MIVDRIQDPRKALSDLAMLNATRKRRLAEYLDAPTPGRARRAKFYLDEAEDRIFDLIESWDRL